MCFCWLLLLAKKIHINALKRSQLFSSHQANFHKDDAQNNASLQRTSKPLQKKKTKGGEKNISKGSYCTNLVPNLPKKLQRLFLIPVKNFVSNFFSQIVSTPISIPWESDEFCNQCYFPQPLLSRSRVCSSKLY